MLLALLMVAAPLAAPKQGPWLEMQTGPMFLHESGRSGLGTGPMMRFDLGMAFSENTAGEVWLQGSLENAPLAAPGDRAIVGGGVAGRLKMLSFGDKLTLWGRAGAGLLAADRITGPTGFGGAVLMFQPFVTRFTLGVEVDAMAGRKSFGFAVLPSLRCML